MSDMVSMVVGYDHGIDLADITAMGSEPRFGLPAVYAGIEKQFDPA
jgi:hypothetical protein